MEFVRSDAVAAIRDRIDHPVVDGDGHVIEFLPVVRDLLVEEAGESVAQGLDLLRASGALVSAMTPAQRRAAGLYRTPWWGLPAEHTLDRATAMLPALTYARLDELGVDFAVMYPTYGLSATAIPDAELRQAAARAFNRYMAEAYAPYRDRLEPVAAIPCFTPDEAVAELRHCVEVLGLRTVMLGGVIPRDTRDADGRFTGRRADPIGHDGEHDYDPLWAACAELRVAPTFHGPGFGWGSRMSASSYVYNHLGSFGAAGEATARSLLFAGVPSRYPQLRFCFCEGGVAWAVALHSDTLGHWEKRNRDAIRALDPARLDRALLDRLLDEYADDAVRARRGDLDAALQMLSDPDDEAWDEFAGTGIDGPESLAEIFSSRFFFGCEADDPMNALAFDRALNPGGITLAAVLASDLGHWDVTDAASVLPEAWELVERGRITEADFADFAFGNAVRLWGGVDPTYFADTVVADSATRVLAPDRFGVTS